MACAGSSEVLPVAAAHEDYARSVEDQLPLVRVDRVGATMAGKRIRAAKLEELPYVLVVGDDDVENTTVGVTREDVERDVPSVVYDDNFGDRTGNLRSDVGVN